MPLWVDTPKCSTAAHSQSVNPQTVWGVFADLLDGFFRQVYGWSRLIQGFQNLHDLNQYKVVWKKVGNRWDNTINPVLLLLVALLAMGLYFAYKVQYNNLIYSSGKLEVQYWAYTQSIHGYSSVSWWKIANYHVYTWIKCTKMYSMSVYVTLDTLSPLGEVICRPIGMLHSRYQWELITPQCHEYTIYEKPD